MVIKWVIKTVMKSCTNNEFVMDSQAQREETISEILLEKRGNLQKDEKMAMGFDTMLKSALNYCTLRYD